MRKLLYLLFARMRLWIRCRSAMPRCPRDHTMEFDPMDFADSMFDGFGGEEAVAETGKTKYKSKNLEAERRRRSKLNNKLFTLRSLVLNITKTSKESTLIDAIDHIQMLKKQIYDLKLGFQIYLILKTTRSKGVHRALKAWLLQRSFKSQEKSS